MADQTRSIFNKKAAQKLRNPDDLDQYVRVTNPSAWALIAACVLLLAGLLSWGVFGSVSSSVSATGTMVGGRTLCLLAADDAARVHVGDKANVGGCQQVVADVTQVPISRDEARQMLGSDYLVSALLAGDWAYVVTFEDGDTSSLTQGVPLAIQITTERVAPITLLFG